MTAPRVDESMVVLERHLAAPIERIWRAWTDPGEFACWVWGSLGSGAVATLEVRPGGAYRVTTNRPDGGVWSFFGWYVDVTRPRRLSFTVAWDAPMGYTSPAERVTVELAACGAETALVFAHEGVPTAEAREGHRQGWTDVLGHLERHLARPG